MKKKPVFLLLVILNFCIGLISCTKDELTKPATVNLLLDIEKGAVEMPDNGAISTITIEKTHYRFTEMDFQAYRQSGNNYFFTKTFDDGLKVSVEEGKPASFTDFDMPQGIYERINILLKVGKSNETPSITMEGNYTNNKGKKVPLVFIFNYDEVFEYSADADSTSSEISISKSGNNKASILFNPSYWMQLINGRMLQSAKLSLVGDTPTIIISEQSNEHIFNLLSSRIKNASELKFH